MDIKCLLHLLQKFCILHSWNWQHNDIVVTQKIGVVVKNTKNYDIMPNFWFCGIWVKWQRCVIHPWHMTVFHSFVDFTVPIFLIYEFHQEKLLPRPPLFTLTVTWLGSTKTLPPQQQWQQAQPSIVTTNFMQPAILVVKTSLMGAPYPHQQCWLVCFCFRGWGTAVWPVAFAPVQHQLWKEWKFITLVNILAKELILYKILVSPLNLILYTNCSFAPTKCHHLVIQNRGCHGWWCFFLYGRKKWCEKIKVTLFHFIIKFFRCIWFVTILFDYLSVFQRVDNCSHDSAVKKRSNGACEIKFELVLILSSLFYYGIFSTLNVDTTSFKLYLLFFPCRSIVVNNHRDIISFHNSLDRSKL